LPLPKPRKGESEDDFTSRCMSEAKEEFPDKNQRIAVCKSQWRKERDEMRNWYEIKDRKDSVDVFVYDEIGAFGVPASQFIKDLQGYKGRTVNLFINSPGGQAWDAMAMYQALRRHDAPVHTMVDSIAASSASILVQSGTSRTMAKHATQMIHDPYAGAIGNASTMDKAREMLDKVGDQIAGIYADRSGQGTVEEWRTRMLAENWYTAEEAQDLGLTDNIADAVPIAAEYQGRIFNLSQFNKVPAWVPHSNADEPDTEPDNTDTEEESMSDMTAVRAALGLDDEGDPVVAINALKAAAQDIASG
jgi:ATP-dependent protease ClpP protease subunit